MAKNILPNRAIQAVVYIGTGRIGLYTPGKESAGRISWQKGIDLAQTIFDEAHTTADPRTIIMVETAFLQQELNYTDEADTDTKNSLTAAIKSFKDAIACLKIVEKPEAYKIAEITFSNDDKCRVKTFPKDAVHCACSSHITRLKNVRSSPGINMQEKAVLLQRAANMKTAKIRYLEKQKKALTANKGKKKG